MSDVKLRTLDLFSGIGGFSLGLERTRGFETVAFCEIDPFCRRVLAKHWPKVPCYDDVRELTGARLAADGIAVDVICGGFPCQDVSTAGKRAGLEGARSGLWGEYRRIIGEVRPRFVIVENVPGLLSLGMGTVLGDLAALGFDAVWDCVPASAIGAPHRRDRAWIVAHPNELGAGERRLQQGGELCRSGGDQGARACGDAPNAERPELREQLRRLSGSRRPDKTFSGKHGSEGVVADAESNGRAPKGRRVATGQPDGRAQLRRGSQSNWDFEPAICRVADGVSNRLDRLRALGNAVVPQIPEMIGRAILQAESEAA